MKAEINRRKASKNLIKAFNILRRHIPLFELAQLTANCEIKAAQTKINYRQATIKYTYRSNFPSDVRKMCGNVDFILRWAGPDIFYIL